MCSLCGVLGPAGHWSDRASNPRAFKNDDAALTPRRERLHRVAILNRVLAPYGIKVSDWQGSAYLLTTRTGRTEVVDHLQAIWPVAEAMTKRACDPLDPALLGAVTRT